MNYKKTVINILYGTSFQSGLSESLIDRKLNAGKVILTYHNVLPESALSPFFTNNVDVSEATFEFQIKSILEKYKIQPATEIVDQQKNGIYLSFDDGMRNNIEIVEPILKKHGITAMFGICSGLMQRDIEFIWRDQIFLMLKNLLDKKIAISDLPLISGLEINKTNLNKVASSITDYIQANNKMNDVYGYLDEVLVINNLVLKRESFSQLRYSPMSLSDVRYLQSCGHYIASHTHTHRKLSMLSDAELRNELNISRDYLRKEVGDCDGLVYPYGSAGEVNNKVRDFAREAGYRYAFLNTTKSFKRDRLFIPRINMGNVSTKSQFFGILAGLNKLFR